MARESLFNLAVSRALSYAKHTGAMKCKNTAALEKALQPWYLKTRFAYRIPLTEIVEALQSHLESNVSEHNRNKRSSKNSASH